MNNSDFLSDAVALDLGKTGVKVAETLEIEVGEEWWRLINASDVTEGTVFQSRRPQVPIVEGNEIHLDSSVYSGGVGYNRRWGTSSTTSPTEHANDYYQTPAVPGRLESGDLIYGILGFSSSNKYTGGAYPRFRVQHPDGNIVGETYGTSGSYTDILKHFLIWDDVNRRFISMHGYGTNTLATWVGTIDGAYTYVSNTIQAVAAIVSARTFLEAGGTVFSLFASGGSLKVKETAITEGVNSTTLAKAVYTEGGDTIAVAANHGNTGWLFFSRYHNSVGVLWRDSVAGIKFALQSESWATAHDLPDVTSSGAWNIGTVGNLVVPGEGEFLCFSEDWIPTGVIQRPAGWSYPANFTVLGANEISSTEAVILGKVGTTVYHLTVLIATMTITDVWTFTTPFEIDYRELALEHKEGDLCIYKMARRRENYGTGNVSSIFCIDISAKTLRWFYGSDSRYEYGEKLVGGDWLDSTQWGSVSGARPSVGITKAPSHLVFYKLLSVTSPGTVQYRAIPIASLLACASTAEMITLVKGTELKSYTQAHPAGYAFFPNYMGAGGVFHDASFSYWLGRGLSENLSRVTFNFNTGVVVNPVLTPYVSMMNAASVKINNTVGYEKYIGVADMHGGYSTDDGFDGYLTQFSPYCYYGSNYYGSEWLFANSAGLAGRVSTGGTMGSDAVMYPRITPIPLNIPNGRLAMFGYGTAIRADGGYFSSATRVGCYRQKHAISHSHLVPMACYGANKWFSLSAVVDGDIQYAQFDAQQGSTRRFMAVSPADMSVYEITGFDIQGGMVDVRFNGRTITGVSGLGQMMFVDLQAADDEGYSSGGGGEEYSSIIYDYLDREYIPYPFAREGIRAELSNISKTTKITLPETQDNLIRGMLAAGTDFRGSRCILRRVFPDHLDEPGSDIVLLDGYIQDWSYVPGKKGIAFSVSKTLIDVGAQFPKRLMNMGCSHVFKGARCQYLGETGRCLKTKTFCTSLANQLQFGGFPWIAARQRRVMWK